MSATVRRRGYTFAQLPEWVVYHPALSDRAVRLFAVLDRHAGDGSCYPSRKTLADKLGCSVDSVDRAVAELVSIEAVTVERRTICEPGKKPRHTSNLYLLNGQPPEGGGRTAAATPSRADAQGGGRTAAAQNESHPERDSSTSSSTPATGPEDDDEQILIEVGHLRLADRKAQRDLRRVGDDLAWLASDRERNGATDRSALTDARIAWPNATPAQLAHLLFDGTTPPKPPKVFACPNEGCDQSFIGQEAWLDHREECELAEVVS